MKKLNSCTAGLLILISALSCTSVNNTEKVSHYLGSNGILPATIKIPGYKDSLKIIQITDAHISIADETEADMMTYGERMHKAYMNPRKHYSLDTSETTFEYFDDILQNAKNDKVDLLLLTGDILNFPSAVSVKYVYDRLNATGIPWLYISGNHDWHYEGMEGTSEQLRDTWIKNRLSPLYKGNDPLMQKIEINGVDLIVLDNSTYQISKPQLEFFQSCLSQNKPCILMVHIPLYAPGRPVGFGCGHPDWGAKTDLGYKLERRPQWPETGHTKATMEFYDTVLRADNLLGVLAGHIHNQSVDVINGIPQVVSEANAEGGYLQVDFTS